MTERMARTSSNTTVATKETPENKQSPSNARLWLVLTLLCSAQFMVVLDFSIVNVALPSIQHDLGFSAQNLQWIISAYSLTFGGLLLLGGRAGDLFGKRWLFMLGLGIFGLASFLGGLAISQSWLIIARAFQGIGAALIAPISFSLITTTFPEGPARNRALGFVGAVASCGFAAGAILSGLLTAGPGWRWIFFVNVPIAFVVLLLTPILLAKTPRHVGERHIDVWGAIAVTIGLVLLVYVLSQGNSAGWASPQTLGFLAISCIFLVAFIIIESRVKAPLVRLSIFRRSTLTGANLIGLLAPGALGATIFLLTLYLQNVLNYSALTTGLAFLPLAGVILITSNCVSPFVPKVGVKWLLVAGLAIMAIGLFLLTRISVENNYLGTVLPALIVISLGIGPCFTVMAIAATSGITNEEQGLASGLLNTSQQVGSGLILAIISAIAATRTAILDPTSNPASKQALVGGFQSALLAGAGFAVLGMCVALFIMRKNELAPSVPPQMVP
jgi:EmrB/QacA subfamily drug resistance transporter